MSRVGLGFPVGVGGTVTSVFGERDHGGCVREVEVREGRFEGPVQGGEWTESGPRVDRRPLTGKGRLREEVRSKRLYFGLELER